jgi:heterodisulfide reductase subunit A
MLDVKIDDAGWLLSMNGNVQPVDTNRPGVFLAGTGIGPMDIPETVAHASGAAAKVLRLFARWTASQGCRDAIATPGR